MGKVYLVGAGPGDPDLITVKGLRCVRESDVILYDRLVNEVLFKEARADADLIYCGKLPYHHTMKQETINHLLVKYAHDGKTVTRLKGGDPFIFGRGGEEAEALARYGVSFEVVPGISAGIAAPAYAGIPVTHRSFGSSVAFVAGHRHQTNDTDWEHLAKGVDTLAIYMGVANLSQICGQLLKHGRSCDTPVALIEWGTTQEQRTVTGTLVDITEIAERKKIQNPAMVIVGKVVRLRNAIRWFDTLRPDTAEVF